MLKINKKTEYALMVLRHMLDKPKSELFSAKDLSQQFSIPFDSVSRVLQILVSAGHVESVKGINGGYILKDTVENLSFYELESLIEGNKKLKGNIISSDFCTTHKGPCELASTCNIATPIKEVNEMVGSFLKTLTLKKLFYKELS